MRQIPWHAKWMKQLETTLNAGRGGLFRHQDVIRIETPSEGLNLITHLPTGTQVERQDFAGAVREPLMRTLSLSAAEECVGVPISMTVSTRAAHGEEVELTISFLNAEAINDRRSLQSEAGGCMGLGRRQGDATDRWSLGAYGKLLVTAPLPFGSLQPVEDAFLVRVATSLAASVFPPSELLPVRCLYIIHRGLTLIVTFTLTTP
mgnify:CR=1 FL=1